MAKLQSMTSVPQSDLYLARIVLWVGAFLAIPLWLEFYETGALGWDVLLAILLVALVAGAFFGIRHLQIMGADVGEARFKTIDTEGG